MLMPAETVTLPTRSSPLITRMISSSSAYATR